MSLAQASAAASRRDGFPISGAIVSPPTTRILASSEEWRGVIGASLGSLAPPQKLVW